MDKGETLGLRVRACRKLRGKTLKEIGDIVGLTSVMIGELERGNRTWKIEHLYSISEALSVPASLLLDDSIPLDRVEKIALIVDYLSTLEAARVETILSLVEDLSKPQT